MRVRALFALDPFGSSGLVETSAVKGTSIVGEQDWAHLWLSGTSVVARCTSGGTVKTHAIGTFSVTGLELSDGYTSDCRKYSTLNSAVSTPLLSVKPAGKDVIELSVTDSDGQRFESFLSKEP